MEPIAELVQTLCGSDNTAAYGALQALTAESERGNAVYAFLDRFISMIDDAHSYHRSRGLILIAANAKWDDAHKIDGILDEYLTHILDEKPITARQCVQALPNIARHQPHLAMRIRAALKSADISRYKESMRHLLELDIASALEQIG